MERLGGMLAALAGSVDEVLWPILFYEQYKMLS